MGIPGAKVEWSGDGWTVVEPDLWGGDLVWDCGRFKGMAIMLALERERYWRSHVADISVGPKMFGRWNWS